MAHAESMSLARERNDRQKRDIQEINSGKDGYAERQMEAGVSGIPFFFPDGHREKSCCNGVTCKNV